MERHTIQRDIVLDAFKSLKRHASADEVFARVALDHPGISRSTVYRNLAWLSDKNYIKKRSIPGHADVFDILTPPHYHVRCTECGNVYDVEMEYMPHLTDAIKDDHGFTFTGHDICFSGICPACKRTLKEDNDPTSAPTGSQPVS